MHVQPLLQNVQKKPEFLDGRALLHPKPDAESFKELLNRRRMAKRAEVTRIGAAGETPASRDLSRLAPDLNGEGVIGG